ncbi:MAG: M67 family metallopeptidase [Spirochaetia bacterium]|nr:M67 family metallopeptidase [Spirochaetia bacterium]
MKVIVPSGILERMRRHGEETYPHECCGFMLGKAEEGMQRIVEIRGQANERTESRENRFLITPDQFKAAESAARKAGLQLVGIYHSHPDSPARPSEYDRDHAWPWFSYIIVSVKGGKADEANGWQLKEDRSGFEALKLEKGE